MARRILSRIFFFFFQAEDGIRDIGVTGVQTCALPILAVDPRVLVPRPETEHVVEAALALPHGARVVDVGTGSGAVALALKDERPDLDVHATDISVDALNVARGNAGALGLDVTFSVADLYEGEFDAVLSNPPYVADRDDLPPEVVRHEPAQALFAGPDGLDVIRRLVARRPPFLALEVGMGQAPAVAALFDEAYDVSGRADLEIGSAWCRE